jgi:ArsR family transcriptional regulator
MSPMAGAVQSSPSAPPPGSAPDVAGVMKAIADPMRWEILTRVADAGEISCGTLLDGLPISKATMSHHLRVLCDAGIIRCRRDGRTNHYVLRRRTIAMSLREVWDVLVRTENPTPGPSDREPAGSMTSEEGRP